MVSKRKTARTKGAARPAVRLAEVTELLRQRIISGKLRPGDRVPTHAELMARLQVGKTTVQRAFERLAADGFIVTRGRAGTTVAARPPHLHRTALVFPYSEEQLPGSRFFAGLRQEAARLTATVGHELVPYFGLDNWHGNPTYERLQADVESGRIGAIIYAASPGALVGSPLLENPICPMVGIMAARNVYVPWLPAIYPDLGAGRRMALQEAVRSGRTRIGRVAPPQSLQSWLGDFAAAANDQGLTCLPHWEQFADTTSPVTLRHAMLCLMRLPAEDRPEVLIIEDDNLVEDTVAGLVAAGVRMPQDLLLVAHGNYPCLPVSAVPVTWVGFDLATVMARGLALLQRQRNKAPAWAHEQIPPTFYPDYLAAQTGAAAG